MSGFPDFPSLSNMSKKAEAEDLPVRVIPPYVPIVAADLNLESELLAQYNSARSLIHTATYDEDAPLNQKAQAINTATTVLGALIRSQAELYSLERIKKIEAVLLEVLKSFPDMQTVFMEQYEAALEA